MHDREVTRGEYQITEALENRRIP